MAQPVIVCDRYLTEDIGRTAFANFVRTLQNFDDATLCLAFEQLATSVRNPYTTTLKAIEIHHAIQTETLLEKYRVECATLTETLKKARLALARKTFFLRRTTVALGQAQAALREVNAMMVLMEEFLTGQFTSNPTPVMLEGGGTTAEEIRSLLALGESVVADRDLFISVLALLNKVPPSRAEAVAEGEGGRIGQ
ncbi:hypothetical protein Q9L58_007293 [Maublancomyces gigas]|uniref:Uncharacterized protein n=1 Tax=Discina gigas TaxID=1032678 RepID=A0ABR3GD21_9PEZI